jgi:ABC-type branched-subunit amino acid transport system substrate-binding protein
MTYPLAPQDLTSTSAYGLAASGATQYGAQAQFVCTKHPKSVAILAIDEPVNHTQLAPQVSTLHGCGAKVTEIFTNPATADFTPYINKAVQSKPNFVLINYGIQQSILVVKALHAAGIPGSAISSEDSVVDPSFFSAVGGDLAGSYYTYETYSWADTSNPEIATYLKEMAKYAPTVDAQNENSQLAFGTVMTLYSIAKQIGFSNFDAATLTKHMKTTTSIPLFMSKSIINPSPVQQYAGIHQPYVQMLQYSNGSLHEVLSTNGGWLDPWHS